MSEIYHNLSIRYKNKVYLIDDFNVKGVILCNEEKKTVKYMLIKYKFSKFGLHEDGSYLFNIIDFVKYALTRNYDWKLYGKPEWEAIEPKKRKKFMKPKKK